MKEMKKGFIFLSIVVLVLLAGGVFWFSPQIVELMEGPKTKGSPDDYVVREVGQERFVENKKAGLTVKVPDGWVVEKMDIDEGSMVFYSPDAEGVRPGRIKPPLKKGCVTEVAIIYKSMNIDDIKAEVGVIHDGFNMRIEEFENFQLKNNLALKNRFETDLLGHGIAVYVPTNEKLYSFSIYSTTVNEEINKCVQEFDRFLELVLIE